MWIFIELFALKQMNYKRVLSAIISSTNGVWTLRTDSSFGNGYEMRNPEQKTSQYSYFIINTQRVLYRDSFHSVLDVIEIEKSEYVIELVVKEMSA